MSFLKRIKPGGGSGSAPEWADYMSAAEYARFRKLVDGWLSSHTKGFSEVESGVLEVDLHADEKVMVGLLNLAQKCHLAAAEDWPALVAGHFGSMLDRDRGFDANASFESVRDLLKVRIYPEDYGTGVTREFLVTRPIAPGVMAALALDYPRTVASVSREMVERWNVPVDELFALGLANVRAADRPEVERQDLESGGKVTFLLGESFFIATWVTMLEELSSASTPHGQLVAIPNRHVVVFMPIVDLSVVEGITAIIGAALRLYQQGPGPISPNLYWRRGDRMTLLPTSVDGQTVRFEPPDEFIETLNQLHKPEPGR